MPWKESNVMNERMEYALRYHEEKMVPPKEGEPKPKSNRMKTLVKNHGDMVIPASQVVTYHFWEIRRHFSCTISVQKDSDLEVVKWYMLLAFVHEGFFDKITIQFGVEPQKLQELLPKLGRWIKDNAITLPDNLIQTHIEKKPSRPVTS